MIDCIWSLVKLLFTYVIVFWIVACAFGWFTNHFDN